MDNKKLLYLGVAVAAAGGAYFLYEKYRKDQFKAFGETIKMALTPEEEQRRAYSENALSLANWWISVDNPALNNGLILPTTEIPLNDDQVRYNEIVKRGNIQRYNKMAGKLTAAITSTNLSTDELSKISDAYMVALQKYTGYKTADQANADAQNVFYKYGIVDQPSALLVQPVSTGITDGSVNNIAQNQTLSFSGFVR